MNTNTVTKIRAIENNHIAVSLNEGNDKRGAYPREIHISLTQVESMTDILDIVSDHYGEKTVFATNVVVTDIERVFK